MGVPQKAMAFIEAHEYLALERASSVKHEYLDGVIYAWQGFGPLAMAGGSKQHNVICQNLCIALRERLRGGPCRVYMTDVRLHVERARAYFYPDVVVTCAERDHADGGDAALLREPTAVFEVLSDSTETFDRGEKLAAYQQLSSLQDYVLVPPPGRNVEVFHRSPSGTWACTQVGDGEVTLESLGLSLPLATFYADL